MTLAATLAITATLYGSDHHGPDAVAALHDATGNGATREAEAAQSATAPVSCSMADHQRLSCSGGANAHLQGSGVAQGDPTADAQVVQGVVDFSRPVTKIADVPAGSTNVPFTFDIGNSDNFIAVIAA